MILVAPRFDPPSIARSATTHLTLTLLEKKMAKVYRAAVIGTSRMGAFIDNEIPLVEVRPPRQP